MRTWDIQQGDCLDLLRALPDNCIDAIVTDPPYGLSPDGRCRTWDDIESGRKGGGFMGKQWDAAVPGVTWARECLRVCKPGAHIVAFGGQRTIHRLICGLEDAGWMIRDLGAHQQWQGFPKSLAVGKAIDAHHGAEREVVGQGAFASRRPRPTADTNTPGAEYGFAEGHPITAPATDDARTWEGYGTALKPCLEPWTLARKPISEPTIAANVLRWGTGALNIDGCRYGYGERSGWPGPNESLAVGPQNATMGAWENEKYRCGSSARAAAKTPKQATQETAASTAQSPAAQTTKGRAGTRREGTSKTATGSLFGPSPAGPSASKTGASSLNTAEYGKTPTGQSLRDTSSITRTATNSTTRSRTCVSCGAATTPDSMQSSAGRFPANVYACPKASRGEREAGCGHLPARAGFEAVERTEGSAGLDNPRAGAGRTASEVRNHHNTVKPIAIMAWLCRLVGGQPGSLILDPFCGSGTTGIAALREGFRFLGFELDPEYIEIAEARITGDAPLFNRRESMLG